MQEMHLEIMRQVRGDNHLLLKECAGDLAVQTIIQHQLLLKPSSTFHWQGHKQKNMYQQQILLRVKLQIYKKAFE